MYCPGCENTFYGVEYCPNDGAKLVRFIAQPDMLLGRTFDGRYTIVEKLGEGGMGSVYRSRQHSFGREVAIKVVNPGLVTDPMIIKRFLREAKLSSRLSHPNAVAVLDFGQTDDGIFYLVMELVNGRTLHDAMSQTPQFTPERVVRVGTQICDALECAHDLGIVHRDLKPSNVMLLTTGRDLVKVLDFGLAKSLAVDDRSTTMTGTRGGLMGTPAFVAPELALGRSCDHRADLYSLGCILYLIGSGWPPFSAENGAELISKHAYEQPAPMPNAPAGLAAVVMRLLSKNPQDRYGSAAETRQALEESLVLPQAAAPVSLPSASSAAGSWPRAERAERAVTVLPGPVDDDPLTADDVTSVSVRAESPTRIVHQGRPLRILPILVTILVLSILVVGGYFWMSLQDAKEAPAAPAPATPATNGRADNAEPAAAAPPTPAVLPAPAVLPVPEVPATAPELLPSAPGETPPASSTDTPAAPVAVPEEEEEADKPSRSRSSRRSKRRGEPAAASPGTAAPTEAAPGGNNEPDPEPAEQEPPDEPARPGLPVLDDPPAAPPATPPAAPPPAKPAAEPTKPEPSQTPATPAAPAPTPAAP